MKARSPRRHLALLGLRLLTVAAMVVVAVRLPRAASSPWAVGSLLWLVLCLLRRQLLRLLLSLSLSSPAAPPQRSRGAVVAASPHDACRRRCDCAAQHAVPSRCRR